MPLTQFELDTLQGELKDWIEQCARRPERWIDVGLLLLNRLTWDPETLFDWLMPTMAGLANSEQGRTNMIAFTDGLSYRKIQLATKRMWERDDAPPPNFEVSPDPDREVSEDLDKTPTFELDPVLFRIAPPPVKLPPFKKREEQMKQAEKPKGVDRRSTLRPRPKQVAADSGVSKKSTPVKAPQFKGRMRVKEPQPRRKAKSKKRA